jgi:hypothetical protein
MSLGRIDEKMDGLRTCSRRTFELQSVTCALCKTLWSGDTASQAPLHPLNVCTVIHNHTQPAFSSDASSDYLCAAHFSSFSRFCWRASPSPSPRSPAKFRPSK